MRFSGFTFLKRPRPRLSDTLAVALLCCAGAQAAAPFSTFLEENTIQAIAHDAAGNIYIAGNVYDSPIPGNGLDFFVAKLDPGATKFAWFLYLGGSGADSVSSLAVDSAGNAYLGGSTSSPDFPPLASRPAAAGKSLPFVVKLNPSGQTVYASSLETAAGGSVQALGLEADGSVVVTGYVFEAGFPSAGGGFSVAGIKTGPYVARLDSTGSKLVFSALGVGGMALAVGPGGDIFVSGNDAGFGAPTYPTTPGAFQTTYTPSFDCGFPCQLTFPSPEQHVTRLSADGAKLVYSTFLTGTRGANNQGLAVDTAGNAYVTGTTISPDYPITVAEAAGSRPGLFLTKLDPTGAKVVWSVQQGGNLAALDANGSVIVGGSYPTPNVQPSLSPQAPPFPPAGDTPAACLPNSYTVPYNAYVQRFSPSDGSLMATQILSASQPSPTAIDVVPDGRVVLGGFSTFPDVPLTPGVVFSDSVAQRTAGGVFLTGFDLASTAFGGPLACVADGLTGMPVGPLAPGQLITLYGAGIGPPQSASASISGPDPVPTSLGGVTVTFDDVPAPVFYAAANQINASVPFEIALNHSSVMKVMSNGGLVATREFAVTSSNPGLFIDTTVRNQPCQNYFASGSPAVALNADGSKNSCINPARAGSQVTVFLNGIGGYVGNVPPVTGSITGPGPYALGTAVDVRAGTLSLQAGPVLPWAGMIAGLYQLQVTMPDFGTSLPRPASLTISIDGIPAAPFTYSGKVYQMGGIVWVVE